jgi:transposase-like protein
MAINKVQMQAGMSMDAFVGQFGSEDACEAALQRSRWPEGFVCPRCGEHHAMGFRPNGLGYWQCRGCRYPCSLRAGTMMEHSRLPLRLWFMAIYLMTQAKTNMAALELRRHLGVSWRTAWRLKHKIMEAMGQREDHQRLHGDEGIDDVYLGGEHTGGKVGSGSENNIPLVAALQMQQNKPFRARFDPVESFSFEALRPWAEKALACHVVSDGLLGFEIVRQFGHTHEVVLAPRGKAGTETGPFKWLNTVIGNLKTAFEGTHHAFKFKKYAARYLPDQHYRLNRRFDLAAMAPRLATAIMRATPCPCGRI